MDRTQAFDIRWDIGGLFINLICGLPESVAAADSTLRAVLQDITGLLQREGVFIGLTWPDAHMVAVAVLLDSCNEDDAAPSLRPRAHAVLGFRDGQQWVDRAAAVRALNLAANVLDM
jgi:hypothetical protein